MPIVLHSRVKVSQNISFTVNLEGCTFLALMHLLVIYFFVVVIGVFFILFVYSVVFIQVAALAFDAQKSSRSIRHTSITASLK